MTQKKFKGRKTAIVKIRSVQAVSSYRQDRVYLWAVCLVLCANNQRFYANQTLSFVQLHKTAQNRYTGGDTFIDSADKCRIYRATICQSNE